MLTFRNVSLRYEKKAPLVLRDIDFSLSAGECVGLLGRTGSGKTTILKLACGILDPTEGSVVIDDAPLTERKNADLLRHRVGLVMQYPERQLFSATVFDEVAFGPRNLGLSDAEVQERVHEALSTVGFVPNEIGSRNPFALSGGEKRRIALASTLALRPRVLALDEPFVGLSPSARHNLSAFLEGLYREGTSLLIATHAVDEIALIADQLLVMDAGTIALEGPPHRVFAAGNHEKLLALGLDAPQVTALAWRLRSRGLAISETIVNEDELIRELTRELGKRTARGAREPHQGDVREASA